jgi:hypothetical protein
VLEWGWEVEAMALIRCVECDGKVSDRAVACPHCGCPVEMPDLPGEPTNGDARGGGTTTDPERTPTPTDSEAPPDVRTSGALTTSGADPGAAPELPTMSTPHVFISYASQDRDRARLLAGALERRGWPVWWDREIQAGQAFRSVIQQALDSAACVVVLWTSHSVASEWVQEEAQIAKARQILVPVLIDDVRQPLGFGQVQAATLTDWDGTHDADELGDLLRGVASLMSSDGVPALLDDDEWATIVQSAQRRRGLARHARAEVERSAAAAAAGAAEEAQAERAAAAIVGDTDEEAAAARRAASLEQAADVARRAAEQREAMLAAELAQEHAAEVRAIAARRAAREAETQAAEAAATAASEAAQRTAALREAAAIDKQAAEALAAGRAPEIEARARTIATDAARAELSWFRFPREGVATLLGGILVAVSATAVWLDSQTGMDLPIEVLNDPTVIDGDGLGIALLAVGGVGAFLALFRIPRWITVVLGVVVLLASATFLVQVLRGLIDQEQAEEFFTIVGIGPPIALLGGALMSSGR